MKGGTVAIALCALAFSRPASAGSPPAASAPVDFSWAGLYIGGHVSYGRGNAAAVMSDPSATSSGKVFGGPIGGLQAGYNVVLSSRLLLGVEVDGSFPNYLDSDGIVSSVTSGNNDVTERLDYIATLRGRLGAVTGHWLVYATGGLAVAGTRFNNLLPSGDTQLALNVRTGWVGGAGVEYAFMRDWSVRLEYLYSRFATADVLIPSGARYASSIDFHEFRVGLNRKFGWPGGPAAAFGSATPESASWEIHGQTTFIQQGYPSFNSPYLGANSFTPWAQTRNTWTMSAFLGVHVWEGGELYYNPDLLQGFGLHDTTGAAGFPNGEAQKSDFAYPHYNTTRLFLRQTFGFGGEQEKLDGGANQLSDKVDISRLTIQAGKFAVTDVFDGNSYAKDPRKDFMNWAIWAPGAFDYSADKVGLSYGATAELNQKGWAVRAGYFLIDAQSNSNNFDMHMFQRGEYVGEVERRYALWGHPGKLRLIGWINSAFSGSYRATLDTPALNLDITQTREGRIKYGYVVSVEQSVTDDVGLFARWSWNDGKTEIMAFTDIDASLAFGASIKGRSWNRPDDTIGLAVAINALSADHRDFIAAGGMGVLIGDGALNYREEQIFESYYSIAVWTGTTLTFDYQLITNPGYNADRGPVNVFSSRLHAEF